MQFIWPVHKKATGSIAAICLLSAAACAFLTFPAAAAAPAALSQLEASQNQFAQILYISNKNLVYRSQSEENDRRQTSLNKQKRLIKKTGNSYVGGVIGSGTDGYLSAHKSIANCIKLYAYQTADRLPAIGLMTVRKLE